MSETERYKYVPYGGGVEELDRFAVRDRIRAGDIEPHSELAVVGTDDWRTAVSYPGLARYFELAASRPRTMPGMPVKIAPPRVVESMGQRIAQGLLYPLAGGEAFLLIGLALLAIVPVFGILAPLASTLIMLQIVRASADGKTKMPLVDTAQVWDLVMAYLRVLFVTIVSLLPVIVFGTAAMWQVVLGKMSIGPAIIGITMLLAVAALYYPACLATVAVWDSILDSLNPVYVMRVIRNIGADYFLVVAMWFVATFATMLMSSRLLNPLMSIPFVGGLFSRFLSFYVLFYVSHLLGYAVYRHAPELGWE
ncbi:MAG TPA: hypothetical protein VND45_14375 [Thermoanaerobaculia bacterium]|jgi:hypothetical protein|nr:hypothetical protein [Thermoanaerobaculia bacterium]